MYRLDNITVGIDYDRDEILKKASEKAGAKITDYAILKRAIDARKRPVKYVLNLAIECAKKLELPVYEPGAKSIREYLNLQNIRRIKGKYIVVGCGPSGIFAALTLAESGAEVTLLERGDDVDERRKKVDSFMAGGELDTNSNIQFGEGGAGTFSDGKLNTGVNNPFVKIVLNEFVRHGANEDIAFAARPHVGTDVLHGVVKGLRSTLIDLGVSVRFRTCVQDIIIRDGKAVGVRTDNGDFFADGIVFAIGHSGRDTYRMLLARGAAAECKSFAIGARIEHDQSLINRAQYGGEFPELPAAEYRLAAKTGDGRGCFTFCMCPGGSIVPATSLTGAVVTNGMSNRARDGRKANSAVLVGVNPQDYGSNLLSALDFQEIIERAAFKLSGSYAAPAMSARDLLDGTLKDDPCDFSPSYGLGVTRANLDKILPPYVLRGMKEGLAAFNRKIKGFDSGILIGPETRSSSPWRLIRNERGESNISGLFPCGEGAGYAGGITSSAADGIKTALKEANTHIIEYRRIETYAQHAENFLKSH